MDERMAVEATESLSVDQVNEIFLSVNPINEKQRVYEIGSACPISVGQSSGSSSSRQLFTQDQVEQLVYLKMNEQRQ